MSNETSARVEGESRSFVDEIIAAMSACHLQMLQSNNDSEYAQEANEMAKAVFAKLAAAAPEPKMGESGLSDEHLCIHCGKIEADHNYDEDDRVAWCNTSISDSRVFTPTKPEPLPNTQQDERIEALLQVVREYRENHRGKNMCKMYRNDDDMTCNICIKADELLAAPKVVDSKEEQELKDNWKDIAQTDYEVEHEEQDGEQEPLRHPFSLRDTAIIEVSQLGIGDVEDVTAACDYPDNSDEAGCISVCVGVMERALKAEAENKLLKAEPVAPPSLPTLELAIELLDRYRSRCSCAAKARECGLCRDYRNFTHGKYEWMSRAAAAVALPTHQLVERTVTAGGIACLQCSCGRIFVAVGDDGLARSRASFEAHLPEKEGKRRLQRARQKLFEAIDAWPTEIDQYQRLILDVDELLDERFK